MSGDAVTEARPRFPNYTQLPARLPLRLWDGLRVLSVLLFLALCVGLVVRPAGALFLFWQVLVPLLPLVFLVAPGVWRNVCPLAAANQAPRRWGLTRGRQQPGFLRSRGYVIAIALFVLAVASRRPLLDHSGVALAAVLVVLIGSAFATGLTWKGKSGWCSSICPLLPVQRLYGQTPFLPVANTHCQPCVGCTKNCYDFNPGAAYQADLRDPDPDWSAQRKVFAGAFPGLVHGFFSVPPGAGAAGTYGQVLLWAAVGAGLLFAIDAVTTVSSAKLAAAGGAAAINLFYWHQAPAIGDAWSRLLGADLSWVAWPLRLAVAGLTAAWLFRTFRTEHAFVQELVTAAVPVRLSPTRVEKLATRAAGDDASVTFSPDAHRVEAVAGATLLEIAERDGRVIEAGCRIGMCGADPIAVLEGADQLSPVAEDEAATLRRLGFGPHVRMACSARVCGPVQVSLEQEALAAGPAAPPSAPPELAVDPDISQVVVIGHGIAGVTAAESVRRNHPDCAIHLVGREAHGLYNRMGISRVVYGRSAMRGLYLLPERWYDDNRVTPWLNTRAARIDTSARLVTLATGETLTYDRLVLATGSSSSVPEIKGYGVPGCFVLREADDALSVRRFVQDVGARRAVVAGGGLLGLEAAYALHQLGLETVVLERGARLLARQVDARASDLLRAFLLNTGIQVQTGRAVAEVHGPERVTRLVLADGDSMACDVLLVAAGIAPNVDLAVDAGLAVGRGVLVDEQMRTSAAHVFAAGDVAELGGQVPGLWPVAVDQAEVAAVNALGGTRSVRPAPRPMILKGVGIDLVSVGRVTPEPGDEELVLDDAERYSYARLIVSGGVLVGGLLLGRPADHDVLLTTVRAGDPPDAVLARVPAQRALPAH